MLARGDDKTTNIQVSQSGMRVLSGNNCVERCLADAATNEALTCSKDYRDFMIKNVRLELVLITDLKNADL